MLNAVRKIEKPLHNADIEELASTAFDIAKNTSETYQYAKDRISFITGFLVACDIFNIMGINPNIILKHYNSTHNLLKVYLHPEI